MELNSFGCFPLCVSVAEIKAPLGTLDVVKYPSFSKKSIEERSSSVGMFEGKPLLTEKVQSGQFSRYRRTCFEIISTFNIALYLLLLSIAENNVINTQKLRVIFISNFKKGKYMQLIEYRGEVLSGHVPDFLKTMKDIVKCCVLF